MVFGHLFGRDGIGEHLGIGFCLTREEVLLWYSFWRPISFDNVGVEDVCSRVNARESVYVLFSWYVCLRLRPIYWVVDRFPGIRQIAGFRSIVILLDSIRIEHLLPVHFCVFDTLLGKFGPVHFFDIFAIVENLFIVLFLVSGRYLFLFFEAEDLPWLSQITQSIVMTLSQLESWQVCFTLLFFKDVGSSFLPNSLFFLQTRTFIFQSMVHHFIFLDWFVKSSDFIKSFFLFF